MLADGPLHSVFCALTTALHYTHLWAYSYHKQNMMSLRMLRMSPAVLLLITVSVLIITAAVLVYVCEVLYVTRKMVARWV